MKKFVLPLAAACLFAAGASLLHATGAAASPAGTQAGITLAQAEPVEAGQGQADDARLAAVLRDCLNRSTAASVKALVNEKPPTDARGFYANKGKCQGCSPGWWRTVQPAQLYAAPDRKAAKIATVPAGVWVYALESASLAVPRHGVVVKPGGAFKRCDAVYHVYTNQEEGETWDTVWRQGKLLTYDESEAGAVIRWTEDEVEPDPDNVHDWWTRLQGPGGVIGWAWVEYRGNGFSCRWKEDPEDICASAPKNPPRIIPGR